MFTSAKLAGYILSALSPDPFYLSSSSLSVEAKAEEANSLPISPLIRAQNPDSWNVIQKNVDKIRKIISSDKDLLNASFSFMKRFRALIPFEQRVSALRSILCSSALVDSSLALEIDRKHIIEDIFNAISTLPASKICERIKIKFKNEKRR